MPASSSKVNNTMHSADLKEEKKFLSFGVEIVNADHDGY